MSLIEYIISLYAPHNCIACDAETDTLLCPHCVDILSVVPPRCYRCKTVNRGIKTCNSCRSNTPISHVYVATYYDDESARRLLHLVKYGRARAGVQSMADCIMPRLQGMPVEAVLVPVPTASSRVRQRGFDQSVLLAREISARTGRPVAHFLARLGQAHQVGAGRAERITHLKGAFRPLHTRSIRGTYVVLVDDVLTTGATLETAARVLKAAGATQVDAIVFAQAG